MSSKRKSRTASPEAEATPIKPEQIRTPRRAAKTTLQPSSRKRETTSEAIRSTAITALLITLAITALVYSGSVFHGFISWDDDIHVVLNKHLVNRNGMDLGFFWMHPYEALYIPLSYMMYALLVHLASTPSITGAVLLHPYVFHIANLVLHVANTAFVFAILNRLTGKSWAAAAGTLLFALHPFQVESVAWISEMRGLLAGLFCLSAIVAYLKAVESTRPLPQSHADKRHGSAAFGQTSVPDERAAMPPGLPIRSGWYWLALGLTAAGLLSKPAAAALPFALFVLDHWSLGRPLRASALSAAPFLLVVAPFLVITQQIQPISDAAGCALWQRPFVAGDALAFYFEKLFLPLHLCTVYDKAPKVVLANSEGYLDSLIPAAVAIVIFVFRKGRPWLVAGALFSVAMLLPVLGLVPFAYQTYSTVADRYMYLTMLGPAIIVSHLLGRSERPFSTPAYGVAALILAALTFITVGQIAVWKNGLTLMGYASRTTPDSEAMHNDYGIYLDKAQRFDEAIAEYQTAIKCDPTAANVYQNLGDALHKTGQVDEALDEYRQALQLDPTLTNARSSMALILVDDGDPTEAASQLETCLQQVPDDPIVLSNYGSALLALGRTADAAVEYQRALQYDPDNIHALYTLGSIQADSGHTADAEANIRKAIMLAPYEGQTVAALAHLYVVRHQYPQAIDEFRKATALTPNNDRIRINFACCLITAGDKLDAIAQAQEAVALKATPFNLNILGQIDAAAGNRPAARQAWEQALSLTPDPSIRAELASLGKR